MIEHWSWWFSGLALALIPVLHWLVLDRTFAVSGRFSALVDRLRFGQVDEPQLDMAALIAAMRAETEREFGAEAVAATTAEPEPGATPVLPDGPGLHALFLAGLALGGLISAWSAGALATTAGLSGTLFSRLTVELGVPAPLLLGFGGLLVGFGTRMAGGCTSGHGLCGVSQLQPGSLLATAAFFAAGVGLSLVLGALL